MAKEPEKPSEPIGQSSRRPIKDRGEFGRSAPSFAGDDRPKLVLNVATALAGRPTMQEYLDPNSPHYDPGRMDPSDEIDANMRWKPHPSVEDHDTVPLRRRMEEKSKVERFSSALKSLQALRENRDLDPARSALVRELEAHIQTVFKFLVDPTPQSAASASSFRSESKRDAVLSLPLWRPEISNLTAEQHWRKYYEPIPYGERPTMGELGSVDSRFLEALRKHAKYRKIAFDSLLPREPGRQRGRKRRELTEEDALRMLEKKRAWNRANAAKRRQELKKSRHKQKPRATGPKPR